MKKLDARVPMISAQPSTNTKSITLKGSEMISGESITTLFPYTTLFRSRKSVV